MASILAALVVATAAVLLLATPLTAVRHVVVTGARHTPPSAVAATATSQLGTPQLRLDTGAVQRAGARLPWVVGLRLERRWPHTIVLHVREATAVAALPVPGGGYSLVDAGGRQIVRTPDPAPGVPVVGVDAAVAGPRAVSAAAAVAAGLPPALREQVSAISAVSEDDVRLTLTTGAQVAWGSPAKAALKAQVLTALMSRHARAYDVSAPAAPATS